MGSDSQARHAEPPHIVDEQIDAFGAEAAAPQLTEPLELVRWNAVRVAANGRALLSPPFGPDRDRVDGPPWTRSTLVVFGAHGIPASRRLGRVLARVRADHDTRIAWRHYPDPLHPAAAIYALAVEAAAVRGRFWTLTRELLALHHHDPADLSAAMVRAGLDPGRTTAAMRTGIGADRIVDEAASALASGVVAAPALFIDGERYAGELEPEAVAAELRAIHHGPWQA